MRKLKLFWEEVLQWSIDEDIKNEMNGWIAKEIEKKLKLFWEEVIQWSIDEDIKNEING